MAVKFTNGTQVRQVIAPIAGEVVRFSFDETNGELSYIVRWTTEDGEVHERAFGENDIEAV